MTHRLKVCNLSELGQKEGGKRANKRMKWATTVPFVVVQYKVDSKIKIPNTNTNWEWRWEKQQRQIFFGPCFTRICNSSAKCSIWNTWIWNISTSNSFVDAAYTDTPGYVSANVMCDRKYWRKKAKKRAGEMIRCLWCFRQWNWNQTAIFVTLFHMSTCHECTRYFSISDICTHSAFSSDTMDSYSGFTIEFFLTVFWTHFFLSRAKFFSVYPIPICELYCLHHSANFPTVAIYCNNFNRTKCN